MLHSSFGPNFTQIFEISSGSLLYRGIEENEQSEKMFVRFAYADSNVVYK